MNQPPASSQLAAATHRDYALSSDFARLCLPGKFADKTRKLAYVDSICLAFLVIGLAGIKQQQVIEKLLSPPTDSLPVIFVPPDEPLTQPDTPHKPEEPQDTTIETPQVVTVAAPSAVGVAFAVPVEGPVVIARSPQFASPPPTKPRQPQMFVFGQARGTFPWPKQQDLPPELQRRVIESKLLVYLFIDSSGAPVKVEIKDSSGDVYLDRFAVQWIKRRWRGLPGETHEWLVPWEYSIK